jgi:acylphosphatase
VQGVYFRHSAAQRARAVGITGHAHNLGDGSVEVLACGSVQALREFAGWLWVGPPAASVTAVEEGAAQLPPEGVPREFTTA